MAICFQRRAENVCHPERDKESRGDAFDGLGPAQRAAGHFMTPSHDKNDVSQDGQTAEEADAEAEIAAGNRETAASAGGLVVNGRHRPRQPPNP